MALNEWYPKGMAGISRCEFLRKSSGEIILSVAVESEQRMKTVLPEMTIKRHFLLLAVGRIFR